MTRPLLRSFGLSQQLLLAFVAGAIGVPAFAPFNLWPLALVSLFVLFLLWREAATTARAFATGFVWGLGLFVAGVSWIFVSLNVYGNMPAILAALATLLFCAYLALFPALAGWLQHWLARRFALSTTWVSLALAPASFALFEYARGWFITGFPWLTSGYSQAPDGWLIGLAPIVGVHGISLVLACTAGVLALPWARTGVRTKTVAVAVLALIWAVAFALHGVAWSESAGKPFRVALLQGNVEQQLKWRDDERARILADYATLLRASHARLIVMPESALPDLLEHIPVEYIDAIRRQDGHWVVVTSKGLIVAR